MRTSRNLGYRRRRFVRRRRGQGIEQRDFFPKLGDQVDAKHPGRPHLRANSEPPAGAKEVATVEADAAGHAAANASGDQSARVAVVAMIVVETGCAPATSGIAMVSAEGNASYQQ